MQPVSSQEVLTKEFSRYVALADVPVTGRVRVGEDFQIYPVPVGSPTTNYIDGTYPFVIEIAYLATNQPLRNEQGHILVEPWVINQQRAFERLTEVLITLTGLTLYRLHYPKPKGAWYLPLHDREPGKLPMPQWGQQGYLHPDIGPRIENFTHVDGEPIPLVAPDKYFNVFGRPIDQVLELPADLEIKLAYADALPPKARQAFLSSCSLFDQGLEFWQHHPSLSYASFVSSIEALIEYDYRKVKRNRCPQCGEVKHGVTQKFRDFCQKYCPNPTDLEPVLGKIYSYRSKILHAGKLMLGDLILPRVGTWDNEEERGTHRALIRISRTSLGNWLLTHGKAR